MMTNTMTERERIRDRERQRGRETERDRDRQTDRQRQTQRGREGERVELGVWALDTPASSIVHVTLRTQNNTK